MLVHHQPVCISTMRYTAVADLEHLYRAVYTHDLGMLGLNDDTLADVVRAADDRRVLQSLASTCRRLAAVARSEIPIGVWIHDSADAAAFIQHGPAFTACYPYHVDFLDAATLGMLPEVLLASEKLDLMTTLHMELLTADLDPPANPQLEDIDRALSTSLYNLPRLQQLQELWLMIPAVGARTAGCLGSLRRLTSLTLYQEDGPQEWIGMQGYQGHPQDLSALSGLVSLKELHVHADVSVAPVPPGAARPCCLPSSLQLLEVRGEGIPYWLNHVAACPQLVALHVQYSYSQHPTAHPAAVLKLGGWQRAHSHL